MIGRAWHFVTRKYRKSLLMLLILFSISTLLVSGIAIKKAVEIAKDEVGETIGVSFTVSNNVQYSMGTSRGTGTVPMSLIKEIRAIDGVLDSVLNMNCLTRIDNAVLVDNPENPGPQYMPLEEEYKNALAFDGVSRSDLDTLFRLGTIKLSQGRHLQEGDSFKSLVHEEFAEANGLKLGDDLILSPFEDDVDNHNPATEPIRTEIVGLFSGKNMAQVAYADELYENIILTDLETTRALYGVTADMAIYDNATFFVEDAKELEHVMDEAAKIDADWQTYQLVTDGQRYQTLENSASMLVATVRSLIYGTFIVGAVVLTLILFMWIRSRVAEIGIMLSLGISRVSIVLQHVFELIFIGAPSLALAYFSGQAVSQVIGDILVKQSAENALQAAGTGGLMLGADANTSALVSTVDELAVTTKPSDLVVVGLLLLAVIVVSVLIANIPMMRRKPKEILAKIA